MPCSCNYCFIFRNVPYAVRATLVSTEALKSRGKYRDAAMQFIKMMSEVRLCHVHSVPYGTVLQITTIINFNMCNKLQNRLLNRSVQICPTGIFP